MNPTLNSDEQVLWMFESNRQHMIINSALLKTHFKHERENIIEVINKNTCTWENETTEYNKDKTRIFEQANFGFVILLISGIKATMKNLTSSNPCSIIKTCSYTKYHSMSWINNSKNRQ